MSKQKWAKIGFRTARQHPGAVITAASFSARHWPDIARTVRGVRNARSSARQLTNPVVRSEVQSALSEFADGMRRVRAIGYTNALEDKNVAKHLDRSLKHFSRALEKPSKRRGPGFLLCAGIIVLAGAIGLFGLRRLNSAGPDF